MDARPPVPFSVQLPHEDSEIVAASGERLWVCGVRSDSSKVNAARFRFIFGQGARDHFEVEGVRLTAYGVDGNIEEDYEDVLVHRIVGNGRIGVFWHGPPRPGHAFECSAGHGIELRTGKTLWSSDLMCAMSGGFGLGTDRGSGRSTVFELATGDTRVEFEAAHPTSMAVGAERAYVMERARCISAYGLERGERLWTHGSADFDDPTRSCHGIAFGDGLIWYASSKGMLGLDPATGEVRVRHPIQGSVGDVITTLRGALCSRASSTDLVDRDGFHRISDLDMSKRVLRTNGNDVLVFGDPGLEAVRDLALISGDGVVQFFELEQPVFRVAMGEHVVAMRVEDRWVVVTPLAELADPSLDTVADDHGHALAKRARIPKPKPSASMTKLAKALIDAGLMPGMNAAQRSALLLDLFGKGKANEFSAARLLQTVPAEDALARGVVVHDWRFGQETDDVIAEFELAVTGSRVRFRQSSNDAQGIAMRVERSEHTEEVRFSPDTPLSRIAARIDGYLEQAGEAKRIYALPTDGDWFAFIIVDASVARALRAAKIPFDVP